MDIPHRQTLPSAGKDEAIANNVGGKSLATVGNGGWENAVNGGALSSPHDSLIFLHRIQTRSSILAVAVDDQCVFAGLQGGKIQAWSLTSYEPVLSVDAHEESVLCLFLPPEHNILFSSGGDREVNIWSTDTFERLYCIHSYHDVGDLFSLIYSSSLKTIYCGAQNASIQWHTVQTSTANHPSEDRPLSRQHRFFDSTGPGGAQTPPSRAPPSDTSPSREGDLVSFRRNHFKPFAHSGYVSCLVLVQGLVEDRPETETLISGAADGTVKLWDLESPRGDIHERKQLDNGDGTSLFSLAVEDTFLYCGLRCGTINIWGLESCQLVRTLKTHSVHVLTLNVFKGSIFSGGCDGMIVNLNAQNDLIGEWKAHQGKILASSMTTSEKMRLFITGAGSGDNSLAFWDASGDDSFQDTQEQSNDRMIRSLAEFVSYKTVSSKSEYAGDCYQAATFLRKLCYKFGARTTSLLNAGPERNPVVFARFSGYLADSHRRTILFYGHYDVINAENTTRWETDPFTLSPANSYLYGRGVSDNKGPVTAALYAVGDLTKDNKLPHDVIFLIEGEEESGSRGFEDTVRNHKDMFGQIDWILLSNSYWLDDHIPCLTYGLRGVVQVNLQIDSVHPDLHSGIDGSSMLDEPVKDLILLLSTLVGPSGQILLPDFHASVLPLTPAEAARYEAISRALHLSHSEIDDRSLFINSLIQRWTRPALTVHRIDVSGPGNNTTIPSSAKANISLRLVPNQDARAVASALTTHLQTRFNSLGSKNRLTVTPTHLADPWLGDPENAIFQTLSAAVRSAWFPTPPAANGDDDDDDDNNNNTNFSSLTHHNNPHPTPIPHLQHQQSISTPHKPRPTSNSNSAPIPTSSSLFSSSSCPSSSSTSSTTRHKLSASASTTTSTSPHQPAHTPLLLYIREGGSIPAIRFLEKEFDAPAAQFPCGQASDHAHLDNERLRVENLYKGREVFRRVFAELPNRNKS